jgi:hypothetical protein
VKRDSEATYIPCGASAGDPIISSYASESWEVVGARDISHNNIYENRGSSVNGSLFATRAKTMGN